MNAPEALAVEESKPTPAVPQTPTEEEAIAPEQPEEMEVEEPQEEEYIPENPEEETADVPEEEESTPENPEEETADVPDVEPVEEQEIDDKEPIVEAGETPEVTEEEDKEALDEAIKEMGEDVDSELGEKISESGDLWTNFKAAALDKLKELHAHGKKAHKMSKEKLAEWWEIFKQESEGHIGNIREFRQKWTDAAKSLIGDAVSKVKDYFNKYFN